MHEKDFVRLDSVVVEWLLLRGRGCAERRAGHGLRRMQAMDATSASPAWHTWMPQTAHLLVNSDDEILFQQLTSCPVPVTCDVDDEVHFLPSACLSLSFISTCLVFLACPMGHDRCLPKYV
jgi:hypothetical protein